jgi:hypothetical protein
LNDSVEPCQGHLDPPRAERAVTGWVRSPRAPDRRLIVRLVAGQGRVLAEAVADQPRPDLAEVGMPQPDCGFVLVVPDGAAGALSVRVVDPDWLIGPVSPAPTGVGEAPPASPVGGDRGAVLEAIVAATAALEATREQLAQAVFGHSGDRRR